MLKRILSLTIFVIIIVFGYLQKDTLLQIIKDGGSLSIMISILFVAICAFFPVIPFPVLAGTIGAVFGATNGVFISLTGAMAGTMVFFFISRYGFRTLAQEKLKKYSKLNKYEHLLSENSFFTILSIRMIPIIPAIVFNLICSLSKVKWFIFFTASTIGKIPNILILSYAGAAFTSNKLFSFGLYGIYLILIVLISYSIFNRRMSKD